MCRWSCVFRPLLRRCSATQTHRASRTRPSWGARRWGWQCRTCGYSSSLDTPACGGPSVVRSAGTLASNRRGARAARKTNAGAVPAPQVRERRAGPWRVRRGCAVIAPAAVTGTGSRTARTAGGQDGGDHGPARREHREHLHPGEKSGRMRARTLTTPQRSTTSPPAPTRTPGQVHARSGPRHNKEVIQPRGPTPRENPPRSRSRAGSRPVPQEPVDAPHQSRRRKPHVGLHVCDSSSSQFALEVIPARQTVEMR